MVSAANADTSTTAFAAAASAALLAPGPNRGSHLGLQHWAAAALWAV
jgi:hypothetical protein